MFHIKNRYLDDEPGPGEPPADPPADPPGNFPDDWRELASGGDEAKLAYASKYTSPVELLNAGMAAKQKIDSGDWKKNDPFPNDGKDEDKAAWRKDRGIPETHDKYNLEGFEVPEESKDRTESFLQAAHGTNLSPEQVTAVLNWDIESRQGVDETRAESDKEAFRASQDSLRAEWGNDYRGTINRIESMMTSYGAEGLNEMIAGARGADGMLLSSSPDFIKFMANMATEINPVTTLLPTGGNQKKNAEDRIAEIKGMMHDKTGEYWKGPKSEAIQAEYIELLDFTEKMAARK